MAKLVLCHVAKLSKIKQMWHLQMICFKFAIEVNPFFRPVIVISGERERNTKDEKQEKWRSSRKDRILFICHLFPSPHFFLMLFIFPHSHIISNAAAGADKLTHSELFGPENVCFTFW